MDLFLLDLDVRDVDVGSQLGYPPPPGSLTFSSSPSIKLIVQRFGMDLVDQTIKDLDGLTASRPSRPSPLLSEGKIHHGQNMMGLIKFSMPQLFSPIQPYSRVCVRGLLFRLLDSEIKRPPQKALRGGIPGDGFGAILRGTVAKD